MALFSLADLSKEKYIIKLVNDIKNKKPIKMSDGKSYLIEYSNTFKDIEKVMDSFDKYKKYFLSGTKHNPIFKTKKGEIFTFIQIDKAPYSGMGGNLNSLGKKLANAGELATVKAIELFSVGKSIKNPEDTGQKLFMDNIDAYLAWKNTFDLTPKILSKLTKYPLKSYTVYHDASRTDFSSVINSLVKIRGGSKDSWNPADIWVIKSDKYRMIKKALTSITSSKRKPEVIVQLFNTMIIKFYNKGWFYPVSLKQITSSSGNREFNNLDIKELHLYNFEIDKIPSDFDYDIAKEKFKTKEIGVFSFTNKDTNKKLLFQVRGFPHGFTIVQTEITTSGEKTGGRVGKVPTPIVDKVFAKYSEQRIKSTKEFKNFDLTDKDIDKYKEMYSVISKDKQFDTYINSWVTKAQIDTQMKADLCVKLQGLIFASFLKEHEKNINEILNAFLLGAKKISADSGFFIKIY